MGQLDDQRLSVQKAFKDCKYMVPSFQREFVWEGEEVQELIDDVEGQFLADPKSQYFLGTMIVHQAMAAWPSSTDSSASRASSCGFVRSGIT
jgi:hypothetical protein